MTLHDAIICILKSHGTAMSYSDIAEEIYSKGLYLQEKGSMAPAKQISTRARKHPELFVIENAKIFLRTSGENRVSPKEKKFSNLNKCSSSLLPDNKDKVKEKAVTRYDSSNFKKCLEPWIDEKTKVLILGTMPGDVSIKERSYYLNPRNAFWKIMNKLFNSTEHLDKSRDFLNGIGIGLWDVYKEGFRKGSCDAGFSCDLKTNDIQGVLNRHKSIKYIVFNGQKPQKVFLQKIGKVNIPCIVLPSTSSSNTHMSFDEKLETWGKLKEMLI